jgi:hypothetical protein
MGFFPGKPRFLFFDGRAAISRRLTGLRVMEKVMETDRRQAAAAPAGRADSPLLSTFEFRILAAGKQLEAPGTIALGG